MHPFPVFLIKYAYHNIHICKAQRLVFTMVIKSKGNIHQKPILSYKGLPLNEDSGFTYGLEEEIEKVTKTFSLNNTKQEVNLIDALKSICKKYSRDKTGKKPLTNINLVRI